MLFNNVASGLSPMRILLIISVGFFILILTFFGTLAREYGFDTLKPVSGSSNGNDASSPPAEACDSTALLDDTAHLLARLMKPVIHGMTEKEYKASNGKTYHLPDGEQIWTEPLGNKVLILDVDSRYEDGEGTIFNETTLHRNGVQKRAAGRLSHMVYAMVHGYDYRFVRAPNFADRHGTWTKVPILREAVKKYDTVVFMDADAYFVHTELPLEWMMNFWKTTKDTSLTLAKDPDTKGNRDSKGLVLLNTGFIIAQKSERTQEILTELENCPNEKRWKGCDKWRQSWAHEQRAFGEYIRYDYDLPTDILSLPMSYANSPHGIFIRHDWPKKKDPMEDMQRSLMDMLVARTHMQFHQSMDEYYRDLGSMEHPLHDVSV